MKAISVKQPWAYLLCSGIKGIENRTWRLPEKMKGKRVLIHASGKPDKEPYMLFNDAQIDAIGENMMDVVASYHTTSAIIGSVVFTDCVINHPSVWAEKTNFEDFDFRSDEFNLNEIKPVYNWVVSDPILFDKPILNVKGKLSFWNYPSIYCEPNEEGRDVCCCNLGIDEKDQVLSYGNGDYRCKYCGGRWYR